MQFLEIQEPEGILKRDRSVTAVGIDLGTTYSLVAYSIDQNPVIIPDELLESKTSSIIAITREHDLLVGNKATIFYGHDNVKIISSAKRLMGQSTIFNVHGKEMGPVEVASHILSKLKSIAKQHLKKEVVQAVITVPAYFDEAQRQATKQAAKLAGLEVLRIINEPTAAALAYGLDKGKEGIYVIYDLGGGTFDVSVLKMTQGVFQVLATGGDTNLGGDDIDAALATEIAKRTGDSGNKASLKQARDIKEHLSTHSSFELSASDRITRAELEAIMQPLIEGSIRITSRVIRDAKISASAISGIVLVGGSTRIPLVKRRLQESFPDIKVYDDADPDEIVAMGAAIQAENLTYGSNNLLLDVTPLSLGIELLGGTVEKIILKNTTIPASVSKEFTTYEDGQTGMQFHVVQGEREMARDCRSLARLELQNLCPQKAGSVHVQVTFTVDADGLLTVTAIDPHTKEKQQIEALPSYGLTAEKMEEMLLESINNAEQDIEMKMKTEAIIHARQLLLQVTKSIEEDRELLSEKEYQEIVRKIQQLENNIVAKDRHPINNAVNELEKAVRKFLELKIDKYMNLALRGTKVDAY